MAVNFLAQLHRGRLGAELEPALFGSLQFTGIIVGEKILAAHAEPESGATPLR